MSVQGHMEEVCFDEELGDEGVGKEIQGSPEPEENFSLSRSVQAPQSLQQVNMPKILSYSGNSSP